LTFDLLILKVVFESCVKWATSVPILVFLGLSVLDLGPVYATDRQTPDVRQTDVRQKHRLMPLPYGGGRITDRSAWLRLTSYITVTLLAFDKQSNVRRI